MISPNYKDTRLTNNVEVIEGQSLEMKCEASSKPPSTYHWYLKGIDIIIVIQK